MLDLRAVSLDALAAEPAKVAELPVEARSRIILACSAILAAVAAANGTPAHEAPKDRLLSVEDAATRLAVTVDWLYRHAKALPFTVRNGRRLGFSEREIERYIRERQGA